MKYAKRSLLLTALFTSAALAAGPSIQIDASKAGPAVSPRFFGIFLEEIGHGIDGGMYAELIQNRAFEDAKPPEGFTYQPNAGRGRSGFRGADAAGGRWVDPGGYATTFVWEADKSLPYWALVTQGSGTGSMSLDMTNPVHANTPRSLKLEVTAVPAGGRVGIANEGFCATQGNGAIGVKAGETYELTFYAKASAGYTGSLKASVENPEGFVSDVATIENIGPQWKQYKATIKATKDEARGYFLLTTNAPGTLWFDMVSLFPTKTFKNRPNGFRTDIAQLVADLKPGSVRFPGGCVVEAATVETAYNWKNTVGTMLERPEVWGAWDYRRTHGTGLHEYFQFIEDIGADPLYVGFAGQTCVYRQAEVVPMDQMGPIVQSYIDLVEYANGGPDTKYGKMRVDAGHAAPFNLKMIEIGNENNGAPYNQRYNMIFDALKAKYPNVETIANVASNPTIAGKVEMVDDHHYAAPEFFFNGVTRYDSRSRQLPPLYLGEVAVTSGQNVTPERGNLWAALAEGAFLIGAEKNSDVVKMVSYAPLLGHVNGRTELAGAPPPWHAQIYFDSTRSYGTVSYYVWKTLGINRSSVNLPTKTVLADARAGVFGKVGVGTWGTSAEFKDFKIEKEGKTLYSSDFTAGTTGWGTEQGRWSVVDGAYRQAQNTNAFATMGDENLSDYTMTVKARKIAGAEGFLVLFGVKGGDRYWWNVGGYGNTQHGIEANQQVVGQWVRGQLETNRWYDVKIEVAGTRVRAYLDGQMIHDVQMPAPTGPLVVNSGRDDATGEIIIKAINKTAQPLPASFDIAGVNAIVPQAKLTVLTSAGLRDNNSLDQPTRIVPVEKPLQVNGPKFDHEFPPYSLSIIRVKPR